MANAHPSSSSLGSDSCRGFRSNRGLKWSRLCVAASHSEDASAREAVLLILRSRYKKIPVTSDYKQGRDVFPTHVAAECGNHMTLELLLAAGFSVDALDPFEQTVGMIARHRQLVSGFAGAEKYYKVLAVLETWRQSSHQQRIKMEYEELMQKRLVLSPGDSIVLPAPQHIAGPGSAAATTGLRDDNPPATAKPVVWEHLHNTQLSSIPEASCLLPTGTTTLTTGTAGVGTHTHSLSNIQRSLHNGVHGATLSAFGADVTCMMFGDNAAATTKPEVRTAEPLVAQDSGGKVAFPVSFPSPVSPKLVTWTLPHDAAPAAAIVAPSGARHIPPAKKGKPTTSLVGMRLLSSTEPTDMLDRMLQPTQKGCLQAEDNVDNQPLLRAPLAGNDGDCLRRGHCIIQ